MPSEEEPLTIHQLEKGVFLLTEQISGAKTNAVVFNSNGVSLMVDSFGSPSIAAAAMVLLRKNSIELPGYLVYTHWHADHTCGSSGLPPCTTIAREETSRMLRNFVSKDMQQFKARGTLEESAFPRFPEIELQGPVLLRIGAYMCEIMLAEGHTADGLIIRERNSGILVAGDMTAGRDVKLFLPPSLPPDEGTVTLEQLTKSLDMMKNLAPTLIIPGHGSPERGISLIEENQKRIRNAK